MKSMKSQQSGFTLVEIAIVLVIIGLLLGGILKGQELINSAKVKNLITDMRNIQTQIYGYQDRFKQVPGDDARVAANLGATATVGTGGTVGNGQIEGVLFPAAASTEESAVFWQHLRLANLASGPTALADAQYYPLNANNGRIGVNTATTAQLWIAGMPTGGTQICMKQMTGRYAKQIDTALDDGVSNTGSVRFTDDTSNAVGNAAELPAAVDDGKLYTVCMVF
ncbi:MAG: prepilin-type N-terminal cleavage/methylation domain-containing protein [Betaproteobacteria bacterium]